MRWCAGKADATLVQQIDQDRNTWQRGKVPTIDVAAVHRFPSLIRQADTEHKGVLVGRPSLPQALRQLARPPDDLRQVEMSAPDVVELSFVRELQRVDRRFGRRQRDLDAGVAPTSQPAAIARAALGFGLGCDVVAGPAHEVELTQRGRQQRIGAIVNDTVKPEHAMTDAQSLVLPARRVSGRMTVEIALVGGNRHHVGMLDDDLAAGYQDLVERQWCDVCSPRRAQRVPARGKWSTVASTFAGGLYQGDGALG